jgi:hypothetical protein
MMTGNKTKGGASHPGTSSSKTLTGRNNAMKKRPLRHLVESGGVLTMALAPIHIPFPQHLLP